MWYKQILPKSALSNCMGPEWLARISLQCLLPDANVMSGVFSSSFRCLSYGLFEDSTVFCLAISYKYVNGFNSIKLVGEYG